MIVTVFEVFAGLYYIAGIAIANAIYALEL